MASCDINKLPSRALLRILLNLPLQELLCLRTVCKRWSQLIRDFTKARGTLKLFASSRAVEHYCFQLMDLGLDGNILFTLRNSLDNVLANADCDDHLVVHQPLKLNQHFYSALKTLFPNVHHLLLFNFDLRQQFDVCRLITYWPDLSTLAIFQMPLGNNIWPELWSRIGQLHNLKRLHLFQIIDLQKYTSHSIGMQRVLGQLKQFSLTGPYYRYGQPGLNPDGSIGILTHLGHALINLQVTPAEIHFLMKNRQLVDKFKNVPHLTLQNPDRIGQVSIISFIAKNFTGLRSLNFIDVYARYFLLITRDISSLKHLRELKCYINLHHNKLDIHKFSYVLNSVEILRLHVYCTRSKPLEQLEKPNQISRLFAVIILLFPSLRELHLVCLSEIAAFREYYDSMFQAIKSLRVFTFTKVSDQVYSMLTERHREDYYQRKRQQQQKSLTDEEKLELKRQKKAKIVTP